MSVALGIQHVKRMRLVVLSSVASLSLFMFLHVTAGKTMVSFVRSLSRERHDFRKKKKKFVEHKIYVQFVVQLLAGTFLILRRIQRDVIINVQVSVCVYSTCLVIFHLFCIFSKYF